MNIFLLRGLVREKGHWSWFKAELQSALPKATITLLEIPGVGETYQQVSPDSFEEMISFMRAKHIQNIEGQDNVLLAMSLGGMIGKRWMDAYPQDFSKVILVNTSFKGITPLFKRLRPLSALKFLRGFFTYTIEQRERLILEMVANDKEKRAALHSGWVQIQRERPVSRKSFINQIKAALQGEVSTTAPKNVKLLLIASKGDRLCHYQSSVLLQKSWGGELILHPSAGHDIPIDDTEWLIKKIKKWLSNE